MATRRSPTSAAAARTGTSPVSPAASGGTPASTRWSSGSCSSSSRSSAAPASCSTPSGWLLVPEEGETESEGRRLMNGRASRSKGSILALAVVVVAGVIAIGATFDSGWGVGGLGAARRDRPGRRAAAPQRPARPAAGRPGRCTARVPPPAEPGAYGQTTGTAYAAPAPAPLAPQTATFAPQTATFAPQTAPVAPPPAGPTYPVWTPAPPPPAPPKERSVARAGDVVQRADRRWASSSAGTPPPTTTSPAAWCSPRRWASSASVSSSAPSWAGRAAWSCRGVLLTALASAAAVVPDVPVNGGIGDRTWRPATVADLRSEYRLGIGDAELDLTRLDLTDAGRLRVDVRQGVGDLTIVVPDDVVVLVNADVQGRRPPAAGPGGHRRDRPQRPRRRARGVVPRQCRPRHRRRDGPRQPGGAPCDVMSWTCSPW